MIEKEYNAMDWFVELLKQNIWLLPATTGTAIKLSVEYTKNKRLEWPRVIISLVFGLFGGYVAQTICISKDIIELLGRFAFLVIDFSGVWIIVSSMLGEGYAKYITTNDKSIVKKVIAKLFHLQIPNPDEK